MATTPFVVEVAGKGPTRPIESTLPTVVVKATGQLHNPIDFIGSNSSDFVSPDQYYLEKVELIATNNQRLDLKGLMQEISYFEDIFRPVITGEVLILDSISLIESLKLNGTEKLAFVYKKSKSAKEEFNKVFRIFRAGPRKRVNLTTEVYTLHFCSEELFLSEHKKVSRAYTGKRISDIVKDVFKTDLNIPEQSDKLAVVDTVGLHDIILPYKTPLETISWLCRFAIADPKLSKKKESIGADYIFYQDRFAYNFVPLETLFLQENDYRILSYGALNTGNSTIGQKMNTIKSYEFLDSFDSLYATHQGVYANKLLSIDPLTRKTYVTEFNYEKEFKRLNTLNKGKISTDYEVTKGKKETEEYDSHVEVLVSNFSQTSAKYAGQQVPVGSVQNDFSYERVRPYRTAQMSLLTYSRMKAVVSGDPGLTVGKIVTVVLPSERQAQETIDKTDNMHSARYIITAVRHIIDTSMKYESVIELSKDTFSTNLPTHNTTKTK